MPKQDLAQVDDELEEATSSQEQGESSSTTREKPSRQSSKNWQDDPEYRRQQAERDRRENQLRNELNQMRQGMSRLERQYHEERVKEMSDVDRLAYEKQLLQQQLADMQHQQELNAWAIQRDRDLSDIVRKTGVDRDTLEESLPPGASVHDAWLIANDLRTESGLKPKRVPKKVVEAEYDDDDDDDDETTPDEVDFGGGRPTTDRGRLKEKWNKARKEYNQGDQIDILAQADTLGIDTSDWY